MAWPFFYLENIAFYKVKKKRMTIHTLLYHARNVKESVKPDSVLDLLILDVIIRFIFGDERLFTLNNT